MQAVLGPEVINSYKRLSYTPWYALAEFVDNSTQAYRDNKPELQPVLDAEKTTLIVRIVLGTDGQGQFLKITDNSIGMSEKALQEAVIIGKSPSNREWRSKYGLGLKTAACWFGNFWTVTTKRLNDPKRQYIEFDVDRVASEDMDLRHKTFKEDASKHYTEIIIRQLNRQLRGKTVAKIKNYLRSIYRVDISSGILKLFWDTEELTWDYDTIFDRLIVNHTGEKVKREFNFTVSGKKVHGWAGVFASGSRADAGFSLIQADRVIKGWPDAYKPTTLFGEQEGGGNDLVNQRLVGEIFLEKFEISHTKDEILFTDEEVAELEDKLLSECGDLRNIALQFRKYEADTDKADESDDEAALSEFIMEVDSVVMRDLLRGFEPAPEAELQKVNELVKTRVTQKSKPTRKVTIDDLTIYLYLEEGMSPNDPYVILDSTSSKTSVIVIINRSHPHWEQITGIKSAVNFIRHCVYDGVAEWKCYQKVGAILPDTVKKFKDALLRVPFEIEQLQVI